MTDWKKFTGNQKPTDAWTLPEPPSWRPFGKEKQPGESRRKHRGETFLVRDEEIKMVNAALYLRRPLLVTGKPGTGKSSLAYKVAQELKLGEVLYWPITTHTTLKDGLYNYDAIGRLQEVKLLERQQKELTPEERKDQLKQIEKYITLGPLGTALLESEKPRILLIDEIDKSDIDLPNDLLTLFEEGRFEIPELVRLKEEVPRVDVRTAYTDTTDITKKDIKTSIEDGLVICKAFPFVILTSNGERDFPAPFLRRCLRLTMKEPEKPDLIKIIEAHLEETITNNPDIDKLIDNFIQKRNSQTLATDQLLNAIFMVKKGAISTQDDLISQLLKDLGTIEDE
ncbi:MULTISPECIES: MoxR family ATPase [unclassified Microcystis]|uniref:AAA family ATPase n=1 Tax=unclassified Microcystis TaxID=2643300 RepID=UPI00258E1225|nr:MULTISPECIES: MoxR family ATPase [unclassified Microcystis]MCA2764368.1 MoxR family ATPase [Microcystis sp. M151S2]MCA2640752.1 MoxR family ATPase [Microcystis sp. M087S2]MCA2672428.1 MoxR family ATPase [Microcystis sp. M080S2]MCA2689347.1 MoxR family ATPase [Microcystis sp. M037S2]MCA2735398.1 MoxR family ATPase [Microcystis sp. M158S2]